MNPAPSVARPLEALNRVLASVDAVRNGAAVYALLATFASAGLLLAMAESAFGRNAPAWGMLWGGASLTTLFYGSNATGLLLFDQARGLAPRALGVALADALATAHRLLLVLFCVAGLACALLAGLAAALWLTRAPLVGPALFGLLLPAAVVVVGVAMLASAAVLAPLAAPAIWSGHGVVAALALLGQHVRQRLLLVALLMSAVSGLAALVGALLTFAVMTGGRVVAAMAVLIAGIDLPPQTLMAGLFGHGLRSLGAAGAPAAQSAYGQAALAGGGVVFMLALVLPALVYLRGTCAVYLALEERDDSRPQ